ncbi:sphingomyelin phosphodiesterase-like [Venturia canescens]|uniref:sphingomyelin phosphodiesterase-like n=1 Tax=Venturia canescens TaxID=32260 RepID=UPI001C9C2CF5|nr:sphingomyelin phosphodiesterase-like [Venturia canescens]
MWLIHGILVFLTFFAVQSSKTSLPDDNEDLNIFTDAILNWTRTGCENDLLRQYFLKLAFPSELQNSDWRTFSNSNAKAACTICKAFVKVVISQRIEGAAIEEIQNNIIKLCIYLNLQKELVCRGVIETQLPILLFIVDQDQQIDPADVCGLGLQSEYCSTISDKYNWQIEIDENPPNDIVPPDVEGDFKVLQLTDIHYDPVYEPYGNSQCGEPMCCRKGQNDTNTGDSVAGYWGDYNDCDLPWHALIDALVHMNSTHKDLSYIYFTGDLIDHGVWETTKEGNIESIKKSYKKMKETFPDIAIYPIIGNHEPHPLNVFAPNYIKDENFSTEWLYKLSSDLWIEYGWLPESTRQTILQGGFYTVSPRRGHRIIALNNNVCYTFNWWLLLDPQDPSGQLRWLADTLLEAETNGEYVHILAHVPSGNRACYASWSRAYRKIVDRFAHIIKAQFNGHTHFDEFNVFYDLGNSSKPVNVAWNGGSLTTFTRLNPNYKVHTVESKTFEIIDIDTWIFNLTAANETPESRPEWYKSYSFKEEYNLEDLSVESLHKWIVDKSKNIWTLQRYREHFYKRADSSTSEYCDEECLRNLLCTIVTTTPNLEGQCDFLLS